MGVSTFSMFVWALIGNPPFRLEGIQSTNVGCNDFKTEWGRRMSPSLALKSKGQRFYARYPGESLGWCLLNIATNP
jgi:hypothetical protein